MKALAIAYSNLRRMLRDRSSIFFVFIFPIAIILLVGIQFGGGVRPEVGIYQDGAGGLSDAVVAELEASTAFLTERFDSKEDLITAVERGMVNAGVFLPADMDGTISGGGMAHIEFVARPDGFGTELQTIVTSAVSRVLAPAGAARFAAAETGTGFDEAREVAREAVGSFPGVEVSVSRLGESLFPEGMGRFDLGAPQQLVLFTFITTLSGSAALILSRKLGITSRMLATPTPLRTVIVGESLGRAFVGMFQGTYILVATMLLFGVDWGDPLAALLLLAAFTAVAAGAAMLMGSTFSNENQAGGISVLVSLGLAALGGSMLPLELFPPGMRRVAMATPHGWALQGYADLVRAHGGLMDVLPEIGVLAAYALVLFALATWRLRRTLTSG